MAHHHDGSTYCIESGCGNLKAEGFDLCESCLEMEKDG